MWNKLSQLEALLRAHAPLVVAYSGGVDSTCLLAVAHRTLAADVLGVIADSASLPRRALTAALAIADSVGARVEVIATQELENANYNGNPPNRCYFCKAELFGKMDALARQRGFSAIAYGENADDPAHLRPGSRAAVEFAVLAPLKEAGLTRERYVSCRGSTACRPRIRLLSLACHRASHMARRSRVRSWAL